MSETLTILDASPLPPLAGPAASAERLVFLVHRGVNWDVWGPRRLTYWDALSARVRAGTYAGRDLNAWWQDVASRIDSEPRNRDDRRLLAETLMAADQRAVLNILRDQSDVLVLRVRVAVEHHRENNTERPLVEAATVEPLAPTSEPEPVL